MTSKNINLLRVVSRHQQGDRAEAYGGVAGTRSAKDVEGTTEASSRNLGGETEELANQCLEQCIYRM